MTNCILSLRKLRNASISCWLFAQRPIHTESIIKIKGLNINYLQTGQGSKNVLLLPGTLGSIWTDFQPQIVQLPKLLPNHKIIVWDPPGYGKSLPPKRNFCPNVFRNDAQCALDLMNELGYSKFSLLGWSAGGITALLMAGGCAIDHVERLVIWGNGAAINRTEIDAFLALRNVSNLSSSMREPMEKTYGPQRLKELWAESIDCFNIIYTTQNGNFCREEVEKVKAPTLIVRGGRDPMIQKEQVNYVRERIKNHKYYEFPKGKHNLHLKYSNEFNKLVADFLLQRDTID